MSTARTRLGVILQLGVLEVIVDDDDVSKLPWSLTFEIHQLSRHIAGFITAAHSSWITKEISIASFGTRHSYSEVGFNENGKVPIFSEFASQQENAIEQQNGVRFG